jgi:RimJ/RimL family protein N-acetyltransferase
MYSSLHNQAAIHMAEKAGWKPEGLIGEKVW